MTVEVGDKTPSANPDIGQVIPRGLLACFVRRPFFLAMNAFIRGARVVDIALPFPNEEEPKFFYKK